MSDSASQPIFYFDNDDPQMQRAYDQARAAFRYFWRECAWENRRIIPALDLACVKAPFSDDAPPGTVLEQSRIEQMWVSDVTFDGHEITGTLINSPQSLTSITTGDEVRLPLGGITDWMYSIQDHVYGAFTVNLIRLRMEPAERAEHDAAWGLDFGDPAVIELIPPTGNGSPPDLTADHPMALGMGDSLAEYLQQDPLHVHQADDNGWTLLHHQALAGSATCVSVLLEHGADPNAKTHHGLTPLQLANSLKWESVAQQLIAGGAT